jgi:hypothetical protein
MMRLAGIAMMLDGVLQAMAVAAVFPTLADRYLSDQLLAAAHLVAGAALLFSGRKLVVRDSAAGGGVDLSGRAARRPRSDSALMAASSLAAAFAVAAFETTWFNWTELAARGIYTLVVLALVLRRTTLPTT